MALNLVLQSEGLQSLQSNPQFAYLAQVLTPIVWDLRQINATAGPGGGGGTVNSVTGWNVDNTDAANPVILPLSVGAGLSGDGTAGNPLVAAAGITSINGLTATGQFLTSVNDPNMTLSVVSVGNTHQFTVAWAGTLPDVRIASSSTWNAKVGSVLSGFGIIVDNTDPVNPIINFDESPNFNFTGTVTFTNAIPLSPGLTPTLANHLVDKAYVDALAAGILPAGSVLGATTTALPANTYNNGVAGVGATLTGNANGPFPTIDGVVLPVVNNTYLIKDEADPTHNGQYELTQLGVAGGGGSPYILTRRGSYDSISTIKQGTATPVLSGTANGGKVFWMIDPTPSAIGTDPIEFDILFTGAAYTASLGVQITGMNISADFVSNDGLRLSGNSLTVAYDGTTIGIVANQLAFIGDSSDVTNVSSVAGVTVSDALDALATILGVGDLEQVLTNGNTTTLSAVFDAGGGLTTTISPGGVVVDDGIGGSSVIGNGTIAAAFSVTTSDVNVTNVNATPGIDLTVQGAVGQAIIIQNNAAFIEIDGSGNVTLNSPTQIGFNATSGGYSFPLTDGAAGFVLATDGAGTLSFIDPASFFPTFDEVLVAGNVTNETAIFNDGGGNLITISPASMIWTDGTTTSTQTVGGFDTNGIFLIQDSSQGMPMFKLDPLTTTFSIGDYTAAINGYQFTIDPVTAGGQTALIGPNLSLFGNSSGAIFTDNNAGQQVAMVDGATQVGFYVIPATSSLTPLSFQGFRADMKNNVFEMGDTVVGNSLVINNNTGVINLNALTSIKANIRLLITANEGIRALDASAASVDLQAGFSVLGDPYSLGNGCTLIVNDSSKLINLLNITGDLSIGLGTTGSSAALISVGNTLTMADVAQIHLDTNGNVPGAPVAGDMGYDKNTEAFYFMTTGATSPLFLKPAGSWTNSTGTANRNDVNDASSQADINHALFALIQDLFARGILQA